MLERDPLSLMVYGRNAVEGRVGWLDWIGMDREGRGMGGWPVAVCWSGVDWKAVEGIGMQWIWEKCKSDGRLTRKNTPCL